MLATGIRDLRTAHWDWGSEGFGLLFDVPLKIISVSYVSREGCFHMWNMDVDKHGIVGGEWRGAWLDCQRQIASAIWPDLCDFI